MKVYFEKIFLQYEASFLFIICVLPHIVLSSLISILHSSYNFPTWQPHHENTSASIDIYFCHVLVTISTPDWPNDASSHHQHCLGFPDSRSHYLLESDSRCWHQTMDQVMPATASLAAVCGRTDWFQHRISINSFHTFWEKLAKYYFNKTKLTI